MSGFPSLDAEDAATEQLKSRVRGELVNLRPWLLAKKGWRETNHRLLPPVQSGTKQQGLDLRGLYEYIRADLDLFREFLADVSDDSTSNNGAEARGHAKGASSSASSSAAGTILKAKANAKTTVAKTKFPDGKQMTKQQQGKKTTANKAKNASSCPPPPLATAAARQEQMPTMSQQSSSSSLAAAATPSESGILLETIATDAEVQEYFSSTAGAWSSFFRFLMGEDKRIGQKRSVSKCFTRDE